MEQNTARQLIALLRAIDADHPKDFVDTVCEARDLLPETTECELARLAFGCEVNPFVSRCCEHGTKGCTSVHNKNAISRATEGSETEIGE